MNNYYESYNFLQCNWPSNFFCFPGKKMKKSDFIYSLKLLVFMKKIGLFATIIGATLLLSSCWDDSDDYVDVRPTGLVTVYPQTDGGFNMQLDDRTVLYPTNLKTSPYKDKVVRALVNFTDDPRGERQDIDGSEDIVKRYVKVNWMDSIRTKTPVYTTGKDDALVYGDDPIDIMRDWVTVAEDGFITLRVRTTWGPYHKPHRLNLVSGTNPDDPFEFVLRHDAQGDMGMEFGDALIAFNLNDMTNASSSDEITVKLNWESFNGPKKLEFKLRMHK